MLKVICQVLFFSCMMMISDKEATGQEYASYIEDCMEMEDFLRQERFFISPKSVTDAETLLEVQKELELLPEEPFGICIENGDLHTDVLAEALERCWQEHRRKNHYVFSVVYAGEEEKGKDAMTPFFGLMDEECITRLEKVLAQKGGIPDYIRLERLSGLDIYTIRIDITGERRREREYVVVLNGTWENQEVCWQYVTFPETCCLSDFFLRCYSTAKADINYDGCADLLIREGHSSGSGGSWTNYRGIIWKADSGEFAWYDSFPAQVSSAEFDRKRMIDNYSMGTSEEHVIEYKVVDGEYVATRELAWIKNTLSYYEMGVLVKEYDLTDTKFEEICALYPDLDYWRKG